MCKQKINLDKLKIAIILSINFILKILKIENYISKYIQNLNYCIFFRHKCAILFCII